MVKYKVDGLAFHKNTDSKHSFCEFTVATSTKKAFSNVKYRLKNYNLRDVSITQVQALPNKPIQLKLAF